MPKRKRTSTRFRPKVSKATRKKIRPVPGYTRTVGFYGRYNKGPDSEMKFYDGSLSGTFDTTGESLGSETFFAIAQGVSQSERIGRKIVVKSLRMRIRLTQGANAGRYAVRMLLIHDRQYNGSLIAFSDILTSANGFLNLVNVDRFTILKDWTWCGGAGASSTSDNWATLANTQYAHATRHINYYKKMDMPIEYSSTLGAITELKSNNVYLIGVSLDSDDTMAYNINWRVRYMD